ncbi:class I SAM-dependent methyltransferase [Paenibacillus sp. SYP-B4298]|uniref:class I SAM-dependent methyltransferase n=1 Tax=Paenibacillus sp. SYP-B4298 TaxID=2996034 RepID=UPI0022DDA7EB|nr:class I SAM-dependent methyltransferase [Paenibacillus sp. SYP-B4298]
MIVTTSEAPVSQTVEQAKRLAAELSAVYVHRGQHSLRRIGRRLGEERLLVVTSHNLRYYEGEEQPLYFHPSMALIRIKRLISGEHDPMLVASRCAPGDEVLDCTAGLGADSLVFSFAVGAQGRVTALESEPVLAALVRDGLLRYDTGIADVNEAMRRIELIAANHAERLASLPDNSYDIVYFDPMFRRPIQESSALQPLRQLANHSELSASSVAEAVRVARKAVVLKEHRWSGEFARLGFEQVQASTSKIAYGVIAT